MELQARAAHSRVRRPIARWRDNPLALAGQHLLFRELRELVGFLMGVTPTTPDGKLRLRTLRLAERATHTMGTLRLRRSHSILLTPVHTFG
jgi:hypothetical protein